MHDAPLVSVVVPAYNAAATLPACLDSLAAQTYPRVEVVVVDDGSIDDTPTVLDRYPAITRDRIVNGGTAAARNRGLELATGEVVAFLDSDDAYTPARLEVAAHLLNHEPDVDGVLTDYANWDGATVLGTGRDEREGRFGMEMRAPMRPDMPAMFATLVARRSLLDKVGPFDSRYRIHEDTDMWYRILAHGARVDFLPDPSYLYRRDTGKSGTWRRAAPDLIRINLTYATRRRVPRDLRRAAARRFAYLSLRYASKRVTGRA